MFMGGIRKQPYHHDDPHQSGPERYHHRVHDRPCANHKHNIAAHKAQNCRHRGKKNGASLARSAEDGYQRCHQHDAQNASVKCNSVEEEEDLGHHKVRSERNPVL